MLVSAAEGYRIWSSEYDRTLNPLLALEMRVIRERLELAGRPAGRGCRGRNGAMDGACTVPGGIRIWP